MKLSADLAQAMGQKINVDGAITDDADLIMQTASEAAACRCACACLAWLSKRRRVSVRGYEGVRRFAPESFGWCARTTAPLQPWLMKASEHRQKYKRIQQSRREAQQLNQQQRRMQQALDFKAKHGTSSAAPTPLVRLHRLRHPHQLPPASHPFLSPTTSSPTL